MSPTGPQKILRGITMKGYKSQTCNANAYTKFQYLKRLQGNVWKTKFLQRAITPVKVCQAWWNLNLICIMSMSIHIPDFNSKSQKTTEKSLENKILAKGNNSCKSMSSVTNLKLDVYYVITNSYTKFQVNIPKTAEKSLENKILAKGNNSCKSRSSVMKLELDLYYVIKNPYTKFQVNISKDCREKSGKLKCDGRTDRRTDRQRAY